MVPWMLHRALRPPSPIIPTAVGFNRIKSAGCGLIIGRLLDAQHQQAGPLRPPQAHTAAGHFLRLSRRHPYLVPRNIVERRKGPRDGLSIKAAGHCPSDQLTRPVALGNGYGHPVAISLFGN